MKRITASCATLFIAALFAVGARAADAPTILVDGTVAQTDVPPIVVDGHVLVPLRGILERFGADVRYDAAANVATAERGGVTVKVGVDTTDAWIDGQHVSLETPARELGGRIEVPLRFIAEALGVSVDFDTASNTVVIVSGLRPGNFVAAGPRQPELASTSYAAPAQAAAAGPTVEDRRPAPDSLIGTQYPQIYARFNGGTSAVDPNTVRVLLDGADVTNSATVSSAYVAYTPPSALTGGSHTVDISGQSDDGVPFDDQWSFRIESDMTSSYVSSVVGYGPSSFGYSRFGYYPPGFSVFAPGPQFFFEDEPIVIVFFSPFFPNGSGFFTISGLPGQFLMTPWLGCPGFFWSSLNVPGGIIDPNAVVGAHFTTSDGRTVLVHATAPLHLDGTRHTPPQTMRFAVRARLVNKPATPRALVAFHRAAAVRTVSLTPRTMPIGRRSPMTIHSSPIVRTMPIARPGPIMRRTPTVIMPRAPVPVMLPIVPHPVPIEIPRPAPPPPPPPVQIPVRQAPPQPVVIPKKPPS